MAEFQNRHLMIVIQIVVTKVAFVSAKLRAPTGNNSLKSIDV